MKLKLSESEMVSWMREVIKEQYDSERLYPKDEILRMLKNGPKELKRYIDKLPDIPCQNDLGQKNICTRIPEIIFVYMTGRY